MREVKIDPDKEPDQNLCEEWDWIGEYWKADDFDELLKALDKKLRGHGLEIVVGDAGGSDTFVKVEELPLPKETLEDL